MDFRELSKLAYDLRKDTVDMIVAGKGGHIGVYECYGDSGYTVF